jgi:Xaa-Pro aminopeptidase
LPSIELVDTSAAIAAVRAIKTPEQVAFLQRTTRQTHRAALDAMAESRLGDSERDMANRIVSRLIHKGADGTLFVCFSSGPRTAQAHAHATDRVPQPGEIIRFDFGGTYGAWSSDFARTYATADPSELQRSTYAKLREIHVATIEMVRPGILAEDVFWFCRRLYEKHGLPAHQAHIGHGFGLELHETPMLRPGDKTPLQEGMVLNIEPSVFDDERSCYHVEDLFVVTQGGPRLLTLGYPPPELPELSQVLDYPE